MAATNAINTSFLRAPLSTLLSTNRTIPEDCMVLDLTSLGFIPWDNPDNIVSQKTEKMVGTVVGTVCLPVLFAISVPCNILNMLVFWKQGLTERINLCLFYLSLVDFLHMLINFLFNVERIRVPISFSTEFGPVVEFFVDHSLIGLVRGFIWISGFISMVIASERCLCIVSPLRSQTFLKTKTTAVILFTGSIFIFTGSMFMGLRWSLVCVFDSLTGVSSKVLYTNEFYEQNKAYLNVVSFINGTVVLSFNVTVVSVTTIVTSVKLRKMTAWREQASSATLSSREVALTRMLITISIVYILCSVPTIVLGICVLFMPETGFSGRYYNFTNFMISFIELASFINATMNFFVYSFLGSRFKETLWKLVCWKSVQVTSKQSHVKQ